MATFVHPFPESVFTIPGITVQLHRKTHQRAEVETRGFPGLVGRPAGSVPASTPSVGDRPQRLAATATARSTFGCPGCSTRSPSPALPDATPKLLESLAKTEVLVLDDWGLSPLSAEHRHDLLEVLEDRHGVRSTIVTSQLPVEKWHDVIGDPTFADAILDRLVHNAYRLVLKGDSMRKKRRPSTPSGHPEP